MNRARCRRNIIFNILRRVPPVRNIQHNVAFCTSPRKDSVWHNRAESYPFRMFPCGMFTPPLWRQAATPTTAPKLLPFFAPPADCACGVPGRPLPPCGVPEIFGGRLRRPLRGAGRHAPPGNFGMPQGGNSQPGTPTGAVRRRSGKTEVTSGRWSGTAAVPCEKLRGGCVEAVMFRKG